MSKRCFQDKHVDLLLIGEENKKHYVLIKYFNTFMYDHVLHCGRKNFLVIVWKPKKRKYVGFKSYYKKIKSQFMIYADLESILVPEDNEKENPYQSYTNKYQKHVSWSCGYKSVSIDDKFSKPFKSYLSEYVVNNFTNGNIKESKFCTNIMKKHFNKKFVMTKKKWSTRCQIYDHVEGDFKVRNHYHITGKYRGSPHRDCNISIKLNPKILIALHNLKNWLASYNAKTTQVQF